MLRVPDRGVAVSARAHNNDLGVMCDWLESTSLFLEVEVSQPGAIGMLTENLRYTDQDLASERVGSVWTELRRRFGVVGAGCPLIIEDDILRPRVEWRQTPAYSMCLVLSLGPKYNDWHDTFGPDYNEQGEMFELITASAMRQILPGWEARVTGWAREQALELEEVVTPLAEWLGEELNKDYKLYTASKAHEAGLDVALFLPFPDLRGGRPVYLTQCASGMDWHTKLHTPELNVWNKIINFVHAPAKAFSTPVALPSDEFVKRAVQVAGLLLDRHRLLGLDTPEEEWLPEEIAVRVRTWLKPRVDWLTGAAEYV